VQSKLSFMEDHPILQPSVWDQLEDEQKSAVIEVLARLIAKTIVEEKQSGAKRDG
jgi:hypothetical protein